VQKKVYELMSNGEKDLTEEENKEIAALGLANKNMKKQFVKLESQKH